MSIENSVRLVGHLGDDPTTKFTQGGTAVTECRIATTRRFKDRNGERQEETSWHRVKFFGKQAELAGEWFRKGSKVMVEGRIRYEEYEKDGVKRYATDIIAEQMMPLDKREGGERTERPARQEKPRREAPAKSEAFDDDFVEDIPW